MKRFQNIIYLFITLFITYSLSAQTNKFADLPVFTVNAAIKQGVFKPINGVNGGPRLTIGVFDNSEYFSAINPPFVRLHDTHHAAEETVDIHYVFPDFNSDENDPTNYCFEKTDSYIKAIVNVDSKVIFRLGESIEHGKPKYNVHPPKDYDKWARICCNVIRHYNSGWADGFEWNIQYWEIWNEFNSQPECWTGSNQQYFELYEVTARTIKKMDPNLKVGGPTLNQSVSGQVGKDFLAYCKNRKVPVDFVSWHGYEDHPQKLMENIEQGIATVKEYGFKDAETVFDEWNYHGIPWGMKSRERIYNEGFKRTGGATGAAFTASVLGYMQNSELDIACYYAAFGSIFRFGFFDIYGLPKKPFYSFVAYNQLLKCGTQVKATGDKRETGLGIVAAVNEKDNVSAVLLSNFDDKASRFVLDLKNLPITDRLYCSEYLIDEDHSLDWDREQVLSSGDTQLVVELPKESVRLILFTPQSGERKVLNSFGEADKEYDKEHGF